MTNTDAVLRSYKRLIRHIERTQLDAETTCDNLKDGRDPPAYAHALDVYAIMSNLLEVNRHIVEHEGGDLAAMLLSESSDDGTETEASG